MANAARIERLLDEMVERRKSAKSEALDPSRRNGFWLDGQDDLAFYVRYETMHPDKPIRVVMWWPIGSRKKRDFFPGHQVGAPLRHRFSEDGFNGDRVEYVLKDRGRTEAVRLIEVPEPCPKAWKGIEVRWRMGRWEKLSKHKGWVRA